MAERDKKDEGDTQEIFKGESSFVTNEVGNSVCSKGQNDAVNTTTSKSRSTQKWSNPTEFLLSCIAMSVGLGNVWRFPVTAFENGGGAFLIPYLLVLLFIGKPMYYMELCLGQFSSVGCVKIWKMVPALKGIGYGQCVAMWFVVTYYVSIIGCTLFYLFASFQSVLPWAYCPENSTYCVDTTTNISEFYNESHIITAAEYYYINSVIKKSDYGLEEGIGLPDLRLSMCFLLAWVIVFLVQVRGVQSSGKVAYFTALFPYVVLFILLGKGLTLPGAYKGVMYFLTPQWSMLLKPQVWAAAIGQSFFSLSVGFGTIVMMASYNDFRHNVYRDATIISLTDTMTSVLAGCTIFAVLGYLAEEMGIDDINKVIKGGGSGIAFISYPDVLTRFDWAPQLFSILFFLMLFTLGIGSAPPLCASVIRVICDDFPHWNQTVVTFVLCFVSFFIGLIYLTPEGTVIFVLVDAYAGVYAIYILAIFEVIGIHWIYGINNFIKDIDFMLRRKTGMYWKFCWCLLIPAILVIVFVYSAIKKEPLTDGSYEFSPAIEMVGILIALVCVTSVPMCFAMAIRKSQLKTLSFLQAVRMSLQPANDFGPNDEELKKSYKEFLQETNALLLKNAVNQAHDNPVFGTTSNLVDN